MVRAKRRTVRREWTANEERDLKKHSKSRNSGQSNCQGDEAHPRCCKAKGKEFRNLNRPSAVKVSESRCGQASVQEGAGSPR